MDAVSTVSHSKATKLTSTSRYCAIRGLDDEDTIRKIDARLLHNFFFWLLSYRKKTLRAKGTLETYWKVFCLVRERKVGSELDKLIIRQTQGVSSPRGSGMQTPGC